MLTWREGVFLVFDVLTLELRSEHRFNTTTGEGYVAVVFATRGLSPTWAGGQQGLLLPATEGRQVRVDTFLRERGRLQHPPSCSPTLYCMLTRATHPGRDVVCLWRLRLGGASRTTARDSS
jgi:hypothetical protein